MQHRWNVKETRHTSISIECDHDSQSDLQCPQIPSTEGEKLQRIRSKTTYQSKESKWQNWHIEKGKSLRTIKKRVHRHINF